ncbi:RDD family protein [Aurantiacibacter xanthus]|uniref:RDD family protein n=1 Tax=Aurantiacibacter xanthus TaxID=1784712 RepID=A0A3A1P5T4_9SPHN|nr:RDD family protein [Aurantiacibacter xanthus]RIV86280.1 RDD family protein [Aurantiacibacter xanthus]
MTGVQDAIQRHTARRERALVTPEGLSLPLRIASRGSRAAALLLDLMFLCGGFILFVVFLVAIGINLDSMNGLRQSPAGELIGILFILALFFSRYGYFLWFELGARGATPGKRLLGIRVAARGGQRLTTEMVIARNLMRDVEVFIPVFFLLGNGFDAGLTGGAAFVWLAIFVLFPFCNRDALRAGDLVAGTFVIEAPRAKLQHAMSLAPDHRQTYRFGEAELSVYGEHELQVLEGVLRIGNEESMQEVAEAICRKIGWDMGRGDEREFLTSFYAALRAHLESGMRFGKRKKDKHS